MRILHVSTRLILGGSQENTVLSCEEQARRGHEVHLAFGPIHGPEGSLLTRVQAFNRGVLGTPIRPIGLHEIAGLVREVRPLQDLRTVGALETLIERLTPDVVHTHSSKAGIVGRMAAWNVRRRVKGTLRIVHTIHGPPFMPVEGSPAQRMKIRALNGAYSLLERFAARRCDAIVSVADAMTEQFLARGIGSEHQYTTVRSGMNVGEFLNAAGRRPEVRARLGLTDSEFVVGTVARLAEHKGHDDVLEAFRDDLRERPNWRLLWVGDGWWRQRLLDRATGEFGLGVCELDKGHVPTAATRVILTGLVMPERVPDLMASMDVLVHASLREGLPRTVPQALLAGACPVAYDVDGTREVCVDGETGRLIRPHDVEGLREAVRGLEASETVRAGCVERGRAMVEREFSVKAMCDGLERVYAG